VFKMLKMSIDFMGELQDSQNASIESAASRATPVDRGPRISSSFRF
jgi:hypothetical protein